MSANNKYIEFFTGILEIHWWKSKGMSKKGIKNPCGWGNNFAPTFINSYPLPYVKIGGHCLINSNISVLKK